MVTLTKTREDGLAVWERFEAQNIFECDVMSDLYHNHMEDALEENVSE